MRKYGEITNKIKIVLVIITLLAIIYPITIIVLNESFKNDYVTWKRKTPF